MKRSIGKKLSLSGIIILTLILLIIVANQFVVGLFRHTSSSLVIEYNELDAIQELKLSMGKILIVTNKFAADTSGEYSLQFEPLVHQAKENLSTCRIVVTDRHEKGLLDDIEVIIKRVDSLAQIAYARHHFYHQTELMEILVQINLEIDRGMKGIDTLLDETKDEIHEYVEINNTVIRHSTVTVLTLGILVILLITIGGWIFIRNLTRPIKELVSTTEKIIKGDRTAKVNINSNDEFNTLAQSFNAMVESLENTTVSKDYLDNILNNMFDALIVTDKEMRIRSVNRATLKMLGYQSTELIGQNIEILFTEDNSDEGDEAGQSRLPVIEEGIENTCVTINKIKSLASKRGATVPVLLSCTVMSDDKNSPTGLIIVAHDLTEKKTIERKLELSRREKMVDINEAQEEERVRIARDLHDGLGQMLTAISYSIQDLNTTNESVENETEQLVSKIQGQIDAAIKEAKILAHDLIPIVLKDFGLIAAIEQLMKKANETYSTQFSFESFDFNERIDSKREKALYRICQESVNNIIKHANAAKAIYQIFWQDCAVVMVIEDDGDGFEVDQIHNDDQKPGIGLISMKERVRAFNGTFTLNSKPGQGTEIIVEIPCRKP